MFVAPRSHGEGPVGLSANYCVLSVGLLRSTFWRCRRRLDSRRQIGQVRDALPRVALSLSMPRWPPPPSSLGRFTCCMSPTGTQGRAIVFTRAPTRCTFRSASNHTLARQCRQPRFCHSSAASAYDPTSSTDRALCWLERTRQEACGDYQLVLQTAVLVVCVYRRQCSELGNGDTRYALGSGGRCRSVHPSLAASASMQRLGFL